jgi:hypothetical protein
MKLSVPAVLNVSYGTLALMFRGDVWTFLAFMLHRGEQPVVLDDEPSLICKLGGGLQVIPNASQIPSTEPSDYHDGPIKKVLRLIRIVGLSEMNRIGKRNRSWRLLCSGRKDLGPPPYMHTYIHTSLVLLG